MDNGAILQSLLVLYLYPSIRHSSFGKQNVQWTIGPSRDYGDANFCTGLNTTADDQFPVYACICV